MITEIPRIHGAPIAVPSRCQRETMIGTIEAMAMARADLTGAYLAYANLACANMACVNMAGAMLTGANLAHACLTGADLSDADLSGANTARVDMARADLTRARFRPSQILSAEWRLPDHLVIEAACYDAANHPDPELFRAWTDGGSYPYDDTRLVQEVYSVGSIRHRAIIRDYGIDRLIRRAKHGGAWTALHLAREILRECTRTDVSWLEARA